MQRSAVDGFLRESKLGAVAGILSPVWQEKADATREMLAVLTVLRAVQLPAGLHPPSGGMQRSGTLISGGGSVRSDDDAPMMMLRRRRLWRFRS